MGVQTNQNQQNAPGIKDKPSNNKMNQHQRNQRGGDHQRGDHQRERRDSGKMDQQREHNNYRVSSAFSSAIAKSCRQKN